jgi:hypothetical protein
LDIDVLGYISILCHKEHPPEVWHIPPGTPCIYTYNIYKASFSLGSVQKIMLYYSLVVHATMAVWTLERS